MLSTVSLKKYLGREGIPTVFSLPRGLFFLPGWLPGGVGHQATSLWNPTGAQISQDGNGTAYARQIPAQMSSEVPVGSTGLP